MPLITANKGILDKIASTKEIKMKRIKNIWNKDLVRPVIYMVLTRFGIAFCAARLLDFFIDDPVRNIAVYAYSFMTVLFFLMSWIAWLRLDGIRLPKPLMLRWQPKKKPVRTYGDIIDHVDDDIVTFDMLESSEQDVCCLFSDLVCLIVFLILALV